MNAAILIVLGLCALFGMAWVFAQLGPLASMWILG